MMMDKCPSNIKKISHLWFSHSILVWSVDIERLMENPFLLEKLMQVIIKVIICIISSKFLNRTVKLSGN